MTFFAFSNLLIVIFSIVVIIILLIFGNKRLHRILILFNLSLGLWGAGAFLFQYFHKLIIWRIAVCAVTFTTPLFCHFIFELLSLRKRLELSIFYLGALVSSTNFFTNIKFYSIIRFDSIYYPYSLDFHYKIVFILWFATGIYAFIVLFNRFKISKEQKRNQFAYIFCASFIAFISGPPNFLTGFNFNIYPYGNILVAAYGAVITYAILKHQLLDLKIIFRKGLVYSILVAFITISYLIVVVIIEKLFQGIVGYRSVIGSVSAAFVIALSFIPLKNRIQFFIDRVFLGMTPEQIAQENELLRQELMRSEKLKAVATFASGMAHEIKNPLTAIKTFSEYLPQKTNDKEFLEKFSKIVGSEVKKIDGLVHQLLDFSKPSPLQLKETDIYRLIDETLELLNSQFIKYNIKIIKDYTDYKTITQIDSNQIKQVFLNLFLNAIEAMVKGGTLTVETKIDHRNQNKIAVIISDTGCGIPNKSLPHIFEPFYSTKEKGTGLGLSIVYKIIKEHKGDIKVESKINEVTRFVIELPIKVNNE